MQRIKSFDFLKFLGIYFVCYGHLILALSENAMNNLSLVLMTSFNMPLFMMMVGFFSQSSLNLNFMCFFKKKAHNLLIPVISAYIVYEMGILLKNGKAAFNIMSCGYFLWFLTAAFVCLLTFWVVNKFLKNTYVAICVSIVCIWGCRYFNYCYISFMFPYFCCGILLKKKIDLLNKIKNYLIIPLLVLSVLLLFNWDFSKTLYCLPIQFISFHSFDLNNLLMALYSFFTGLVVSMIFIILALKYSTIVEKYSFLKFLSKMGQKTLGIYILQKFTLELLFRELHIKLSSVFVTPVAFFLAIAECLICYWLVLLMEKNKVLSSLFLGHTKK